MNSYELIKKDVNCNARLGLVHTPHGSIRTPAFMPVGTAGAVKGILPDVLMETGPDIILANTYHMLLRPGVDVVESLGGLHNLMAWPKPILTDSGGYQIFSLNSLTKITDDGVEFASHIDGKRIYLDAETATDVQNRLGADIIMCFDQCPPFPCEEEQLHNAVERSIQWAERCKQAHKRDDQMLFGIVQGGIDLSLREKCAKKLIEMDFHGYALGGLSVGEGHENMKKTVDFTAPLLPEQKPRYLMGVGMPIDILQAVRAGIDMFDCVLPTRNGRNAFAFTWDGPLRLRNSAFLEDKRPIDENCDCYSCRKFTRAAIRHFFNVGEMLGPILTEIHNLRFFQRFMQSIREQIDSGTFDSWANEKTKILMKKYE